MAAGDDGWRCFVLDYTYPPGATLYDYTGHVKGGITLDSSTCLTVTPYPNSVFMLVPGYTSTAENWLEGAEQMTPAIFQLTDLFMITAVVIAAIWGFSTGIKR